jgi:hypothetical protein
MRCCIGAKADAQGKEQPAQDDDDDVVTAQMATAPAGADDALPDAKQTAADTHIH